MSRCRRLYVLFVASAVLASCTTLQPGVVPAYAALGALHSWTNAGLTKRDLLYVSNADNEVTVYDYADQTLVGVLTGFSQPMGDCSDTRGNIYIVDFAAQQIREYAHGGSKPIKKLSDAPYSPYACSVDSTTGNLAVANDAGPSQGNVAIWAQGSGEPTLYTDSQISSFQGCAYDSDGNLLATSGYVSYGVQTQFAWLARGGTKLVNLYVPGPQPSWKWGGVFGVGWDGMFFTIDAGVIYRIGVTHGQAYYVTEVQLHYLEQGENGPFAFYLKSPTTQATAVVGGAQGDNGSSVNYWAYPTGGNPTGGFTHGTDHPFGVTISLGKQ